MAVFVTPVVLANAGKKHAPALEGSKISPDFLPVSQTPGNVLAVKEDGLSVLPKAVASAQEGNALVVNVDNKLMVKAERLVSEREKVLGVAENKLFTTLSLVMDTETNMLSLVGKDAATVAQVKLPVVPGLPTVAEVLENFTPPAPEGAYEPDRPKGTYLHLQFKLSDGEKQDVFLNVTDLVDVYTGGVGIDITDNVVSLKEVSGSGIEVTPDGPVLKIDELVSQTPGNALIQDVTGKLFVDAGFAAEDLGAGLVVGPDGKLRIDLNELIDPNGPLIVTPAGKLSVDPAKITCGVSADEGNILTDGSDGKPYFPGDLGNI